MKKLIGFLCLLVAILILPGLALADMIAVDENHFPDEALREYVLDILDKDEDGNLSDEERNDVTIIVVPERGIKSLKGVEFFPNLDTLVCYHNDISSLSGLRIPSLVSLNCSENLMGTPDVSGFPNLEILYCAHTGMTSLAGLNAPTLLELDCSNNSLGSLDLSGFPYLEYVRCVECGLTNLNVSENSRLKYIYCQNNRLTHLNVSMVEPLTDLTCSGNRLTSIYLDENEQLLNLNCEGNELSVTAVNGAFDLSTLPGFDLDRAYDFTGGTLEGTVLKVDKSEKIFYAYVSGGPNNPWFCLDMIFTAAQPAQGLPIDDEHFPDSVFREYIYENADTNHDGALSDAERQAVIRISLQEKRITTLEGLKYFPNLETLSCIKCQLSSLDVSVVPSLKTLHCNQNQLTELDVSHNPALTSLECDNNGLTSLNLSANPNLKHLGCSANRLGTLDLSHNTALEEVWCENDWLTSLDLSHNKELRYLDCYGNFFSTLDLSSNQKLSWLQCADCRLFALDVSPNAALQTLYGDQRRLSIEADNGRFDLNTLPGFDVSKASNWEVGTVSGNILTVPDVCEVTYIYDCGNGFKMVCTMQVNINYPGDCNGDGVVDGRDLLRLARYLAGENVGIDLFAADVNRDGNVDGRDVLRLAKQLAGM